MEDYLVLLIGMGIGVIVGALALFIFEQCIKPCYPHIWPPPKEEDISASSSMEVVKEQEDDRSCFDCCSPPPPPKPEPIPLHMEDIDADQLEDDFVNSGVIEDISIIVAIDMTRSNHFKGRKCFGGKNLHYVDMNLDVDAAGIKQHQGELNPYERAILSAELFLKTDRNFPLYYFGSVESAEMGGYIHVKDCDDYIDLWHTYRKTAHTQELSGPGRFLPVLERAMERTKKLNRYHILLVLTDGDVEDQEEFGEALSKASQSLPLSIVVVGVGDGPFGQIAQFDDYMPEEKHFDNLQFVAFSEVHEKISVETQKKEFFCKAFNEIPRQYRMCKKILGYRAPMRRVGHFEEPITFGDRRLIDLGALDHGDDYMPRKKVGGWNSQYNPNAGTKTKKKGYKKTGARRTRAERKYDDEDPPPLPREEQSGRSTSTRGGVAKSTSGSRAAAARLAARNSNRSQDRRYQSASEAEFTKKSSPDRPTHTQYASMPAHAASNSKGTESYIFGGNTKQMDEKGPTTPVAVAAAYEEADADSSSEDSSSSSSDDYRKNGTAKKKRSKSARARKSKKKKKKKSKAPALPEPDYIKKGNTSTPSMPPRAGGGLPRRQAPQAMPSSNSANSIKKKSQRSRSRKKV